MTIEPDISRTVLHRFSREMHRKGAWNTRIFSSNQLLRHVVNFLSYKRNGIDKLANLCKGKPIVLDCGAGNGAYSRWFLQKCPTTLVAVDWSYEALRNKNYQIPNLHRVCADLRFLPFKEQVFDSWYSIDVLGHVEQTHLALDEMLRTVKPGARGFVHSECSDYRTRWPDSLLISKGGKDVIADIDGHVAIRPCLEIRTLLARRFTVLTFFSPAGLLGWLLGYPEKYNKAFKTANMKFFYILTSLFSFLKKTPGINVCIKFANAITNRLELYIGLSGGGSCFAMVQKRQVEK